MAFKKLKKFEDWNVALIGLVGIVCLLIGASLGFMFSGNEVKNNFVTCGMGATCPNTHEPKYIGWQCIECSLKDNKTSFEFNLTKICENYQVKENYELINNNATYWNSSCIGIYCNNPNKVCIPDYSAGIKCKNITLKTGEVYEYACYDDLVMHYKCFDKSEIKGAPNSSQA